MYIYYFHNTFNSLIIDHSDSEYQNIWILSNMHDAIMLNIIMILSMWVHVLVVTTNAKLFICDLTAFVELVIRSLLLSRQLLVRTLSN